MTAFESTDMDPDQRMPDSVKNRAVSILQAQLPEEFMQELKELFTGKRPKEESELELELGLEMDPETTVELLYGSGIRNLLRAEWLTDKLLPTNNWDDYYLECLKAAVGATDYQKWEYNHYQCKCEGSIFEFFVTRTIMTTNNGSKEEYDVFFHEEDSDALEQFLEPHNFNVFRLEKNINMNAPSYWPWAVVLFDEELDLAGHLMSIRTSKEAAGFNSYSMQQGHTIEKDGKPKLSSVYIQSKKELGILAAKSPLFIPAWEHLAGMPEENYRGWVYLSETPSEEWIREREREDDLLFQEYYTNKASARIER